MLCSEIDIGSINLYMMIIWVDNLEWDLVSVVLFGYLIIGIQYPLCRYGIYLNRTIEEGSAHKNYFVEWNPRRNRLTHNLVF